MENTTVSNDAAGHSKNAENQPLSRGATAKTPVDDHWHCELDEQIRFDSKIGHHFQRIHFLKLSQAIDTILAGVLDRKQNLDSSHFLKVITLDRLRKRIRRKYYDLNGSTKLTHRFSLPLSDWIVLHTCLIWDWEDLYLRGALSEIDYIVQSHCHNKIVLEKVNLLK